MYVESKTTQIECYGTKATKLKAKEADKDPSQTFAVIEPDLDGYDLGDIESLTALINDYSIFWNLRENNLAGFFARVRKHILDSKRAEFHRGKGKATQLKELVTELQALDFSNADDLARATKIQAEMKALA